MFVRHLRNIDQFLGSPGYFGRGNRHKYPVGEPATGSLEPMSRESDCSQHTAAWPNFIELERRRRGRGSRSPRLVHFRDVVALRRNGAESGIGCLRRPAFGAREKIERRNAALEFCDPPAAGSIGCDQWKNVLSI
jgi:hypothetical protein